jgi:hypothetical protein
MKTSILALLLALGCTGPKESNRNQKQPDSTPPTQENTTTSGSGSIVGNALTGDETIVRIDIAGPYIGVEGSRIYNYDDAKKRGAPVSGDVKSGDGVVKTELPERTQVIRDLTEDIFILIRNKDYTLGLKEDAYLIRKSDGNVWQIFVGTDFVEDSLSWIQENDSTTLYFAGELNDSDKNESTVYGIKVKLGSEEVARVKLANAKPYKTVALVGDEVTFENDRHAQLWITNAFSTTPVIKEVDQLGIRSWQYIYTSGRAYRIDNSGGGSRLIAVSNGPIEGKVILESDSRIFYSPQWSVTRNGFDIVSTSYGQTYVIDPDAKLVVKELSLPRFDTNVEYFDSRYVSMVMESGNSGFCIIASTTSPVSVICSDKPAIGITGRPFKITSVDASQFKIYTRIEGTNKQQELEIMISGDRLEVQSEVSTPYTPETDTLIPIKNIYDGI